VVTSRLQRNVDQGLRERAHIFFDSKGRVQRHSAQEENDLVGQFLELFELAERLRKHVGDVLTLRENPHSGIRFVPSSRLTLLVRSWLNINVHLAHQLFPQHRFHPLIEIFMRRVPIFHEYRFFIFSPGSVPNEILEQIVSKVNFTLVEIRKELASQDAKKAAGEFIRPVNKNHKSLSDYVDALVEEHGAIQAVRLDLGYTERITYSSRTARKVSFDETGNHRKRLLVHMRRWFPENMLGYSWKLEHGLQSSYRYHWLFFFPAKTLRSDVEIGKLIGEQWANGVTDGKGAYFNWNDSAGSGARRPGTGKVASSTPLKNPIQYMTKLDRYIKLTVPAGGRTFDKGNMPLNGN
jgi:hypothetical protein